MRHLIARTIIWTESYPGRTAAIALFVALVLIGYFDQGNML